MLSDDCISIVLAFSSRLAKTIHWYAKYKRKRKKMEKKVSKNVWAKGKWRGKYDLQHGSETGLRRVVDRPVFGTIFAL